MEELTEMEVFNRTKELITEYADTYKNIFESKQQLELIQYNKESKKETNKFETMIQEASQDFQYLYEENTISLKKEFQNQVHISNDASHKIQQCLNILLEKISEIQSQCQQQFLNTEIHENRIPHTLFTMQKEVMSKSNNVFIDDIEFDKALLLEYYIKHNEHVSSNDITTFEDTYQYIYDILLKQLYKIHIKKNKESIHSSTTLTALIENPSNAQEVTWDYIEENFKIQPLNSRICREHIVLSLDSEIYKISCAIQALNRYRTKVPYTVPTEHTNIEHYCRCTGNPNYLIQKNTSWLNQDTFFSAEGISLIFQHSFACMLLQKEGEGYIWNIDTKYSSILQLQSPQLQNIEDNMYSHNGIIKFDSNMCLQMLILDNNVVYHREGNSILLSPSDDISYRRILSSVFVIYLLEYRIGVQQLFVFDEWCYQFAQCVAKECPEHTLMSGIESLYNNISYNVDLNMIFVQNGLSTNYVTTSTNLTPKCAEQLCNIHEQNIANITSWKHIQQKTTDMDIPFVKQLQQFAKEAEEQVQLFMSSSASNNIKLNNDLLIQKWLNKINATNSDLNQILHTICLQQRIANAFDTQMIQALLSNKWFGSVWKNHSNGIPSRYMHEANIELLLFVQNNT